MTLYAMADVNDGAECDLIYESLGGRLYLMRNMESERNRSVSRGDGTNYDGALTHAPNRTVQVWTY